MGSQIVLERLAVAWKVRELRTVFLCLSKASLVSLLYMPMGGRKPDLRIIALVLLLRSCLGNCAADLGLCSSDRISHNMLESPMLG